MRYACLFLLVPFLLLGCNEPKEPPAMREIPFRADGVLEFVRPDGTVLRQVAIEVAETDSARERGLMGRRALTTRQAMLFTFPEAAPRSFWMANTPLPLDIIFIGPDSQIVNIARRTTPLSPDPVLSTGPAQYVVEVRAGFSDRYGLTDSTRVRWRLTS